MEVFLEEEGTNGVEDKTIWVGRNTQYIDSLEEEIGSLERENPGHAILIPCQKATISKEAQMQYHQLQVHSNYFRVRQYPYGWAEGYGWCRAQ